MLDRAHGLRVVDLPAHATGEVSFRYRCADPRATHPRLAEALRAAGFAEVREDTGGGASELRVQEAARLAPDRFDALFRAVALLGPLAAEGPVSPAYARAFQGDGLPPYCGFAGLWRLLLAGFEIPRLGPILDARATRDPGNTGAQLDIATLLFLTQMPVNRGPAFACQRQAIERQPHVVLPAQRPGTPLRMLALAAPGDLTANTPLEPLLEGSDVEVHFVFVRPDQPLPEPLPAHDLVFVAIGEAPDSRRLLEQIAPVLRRSRRTVLNRPEAVLEMSRDRVAARFRGTPGIEIPVTRRVSRTELASGPGVAFPMIVRPLDSQGGKGLERVDSAAALDAYLAGNPEDEFFVAPFVDYRGADGNYRKYRVVAIRGRLFPCHMAVSARWMVHYVNADMETNASHRAEEAAFLAGFDEGFGRRHAAALAHIDRTLGLDYYGMDCAETEDGRLLVFEIDTAMLVHAMDPEDLYPYKKPAMRRLFAAFREMLGLAAAGG